jgi:cytochrome c553
MAIFRWRRVLSWTLGSILAFSLAAAFAVYLRSEWLLRRERDVPLTPFAAPAQDDTSEGRRLAVLVGCLQGCHGPQGEGGTEGAPGIFEVTAPTLADVLPQYSDPELHRLVRFGVKRDGRSALGMPSGTFYPIADQDLAAIVAHLRTLPPVPPKPRVRRVEPVGRAALALGKWQVSADEVDPTRPRWGALPRTTSQERGRYLASITCAECHGLELQGKEFLGSPPLTIVRAYDLEHFRHLLRTGEHLSGRTTGMMADVVRKAFVELTDQEIDDLYAFLRERAASQETAGEASS